jgi:HEPN domain-containing protein
MMNKINHSQELIKQAEYDIETAQIMLNAGRYVYCVFMCHLSIEKTLKALYVKKLAKTPPKIHSLVYLAKIIDVDLPLQVKEFIESLDDISVPTRYPEELDKLLKEYTKERTEVIFDSSKGALTWLKKELKKQ